MLFKGWKSGNTQAAAGQEIMQKQQPQPGEEDQGRWFDTHQLVFEEEQPEGCTTCADPMNEALPIAPQVLQQLDEFVCSPAFLDTLAGARNQDPAGLCQSATAPTEQDDFVLLEKADAVEAMAFFIASYVSALPEAKSLTPQQLQTALGATFRAVRTSRFETAWAWGKRVYRYAALGYSAFQMYENPWLIKATIKALWFFSKIAAGATVAALGAVAV